MATNLDRAAIVSRKVRFESVNLRRAQVETDLPPSQATLGMAYRHGYKAAYQTLEDEPDLVLVDATFRFDGGDEDHPAAVVLDATFRLTYELPDAASFPADALEHFAELNGIYNAWPYWRELVQTVTGRVGIDSVLLPVFRPPVRELENEERDPPEG